MEQAWRPALAVMVVLAGPTFLAGCLTGSQVGDATVEIPFPERGAEAKYSYPTSEGRGWVLYRFLGEGPQRSIDGLPYHALFIEVTTHWEGRAPQNLSFDSLQRVWRTSDSFEDRSGAGLRHLPEYEYARSERDLDLYFDPLPLNHLQGRAFTGRGGEGLRTEISAFSVQLSVGTGPDESTAHFHEAIPDVSGNSDGGPPRGMIEYVADPAKSPRELQVSMKVRGSASAWLLTMRDGVPFPIRVELALQEDQIVFQLEEYEVGSGALDWGHGIPPGLRGTATSLREPLHDGVPVEGDAGLAYPLDEALEEVARDPALVQYPAWRILHPQSLLTDATLSPYGDDLGRTGHEWRLRWKDRGGDLIDLRTVRFDGPPPWSGATRNSEAAVLAYGVPVADYDRLQATGVVSLAHVVAASRAARGETGPVGLVDWHLDTNHPPSGPTWKIGWGMERNQGTVGFDFFVIRACDGATVGVGRIGFADSPGLPNPDGPGYAWFGIGERGVPCQFAAAP